MNCLISPGWLASSIAEDDSKINATLLFICLLIVSRRRMYTKRSEIGKINDVETYAKFIIEWILETSLQYVLI